MKRNVILILCLLTLFVLSGCIQMDMVVKVNKDGSGKLVQKIMMGKEMMQEMGDGGPICNDEEFKAAVKGMGEGVSYVSAREVSNDKFIGCETTYAFKDVTKINVDQNPGGNMPQEPGQEEQTHEFLKFALKKKGKKSVLTITMPKEESAAAAAKKPELTPQEKQQQMMMQEMMKQMMADMYIGVAVEVNGKVVKSNATHRKGSRITLVEMDFNKLLADQNAFTKLMDANAQTIEETKELMKDVPGIKGETQKIVTIEFK